MHYGVNMWDATMNINSKDQMSIYHIDHLHEVAGLQKDFPEYVGMRYSGYASEYGPDQQAVTLLIRDINPVPDGRNAGGSAERTAADVLQNAIQSLVQRRVDRPTISRC